MDLARPRDRFVFPELLSGSGAGRSAQRSDHGQVVAENPPERGWRHSGKSRALGAWYPA